MMKQILFVLLCLFTFSCTIDKPSEDETPSNNVETHQTSLKDTLSLSVGTDSLHSEITCPKCGYKKTEPLPTEVCLLKYTCQSCRYEMIPEEGDCCVFCTYGDVKCPSKQ